MSDRISQTILLCEDQLQERLAKAYLRACDLETESPLVRSLVASRLVHGGNDAWVLQQFPGQLHACRQRHKKAKTLLLVLLDADKFSLDQRRRQLDERLELAGFATITPADPLALLIPKRHIETWLRALLGEAVDEEQNCKTWAPFAKEQLRQAAVMAHQWARENALPGPTCTPSLRTCLPEWRRIG